MRVSHIEALEMSDGTVHYFVTETTPGATVVGGGGGGSIVSVNGNTGPAVVLAAADVGAQPSDSDLTAIAALSTTTFGRGLLILADAAALRTAAALGTAAQNNTGDFDAAGAAAAAQTAAQSYADTNKLAKSANLSDVVSASTSRGNILAARLVTPTAVKTTSYTAVDGDFVPCDTTGGAFTVTLPSAPANNTVVSVALVKQTGTNAVTVACGGADVIDVAAGATTASVGLLFQTETFKYTSSTGIWYRISSRFPRSQLYASFSGDATVDSAGVVTLATVGIGKGGTGATTQQAALDALAGAVTNNRVLAGNGTHVTLRALGAADIPSTLGATTFTGNVSTSGASITADTLSTFTAGLEARSGPLGLTVIATEYNGAGATFDARSTRGTGNGNFSHSLSGDVLFLFRGGGSTDTAFADCGKIQWKATQDFAAGAFGNKCEIYTVPNGATTVTLAATFGQDQSLTLANNLTLAGTISGATNMADLSQVASATTNIVTATAGLWGFVNYGAALFLTLTRMNGTVGSGTHITSGQTLTQVAFAGCSVDGTTTYTGSAIAATATETWSSTAGGTKVTISTTSNTTNTKATALTLDQDGSVKANVATGGLGYATGAGGAVTQATSRATGVTLNNVCGAITLVSAAGSATANTFTVTNSTVAATDVVVVSQKSGTDKYITEVTAVAAGSFNITFQTTGGTTTEQPVFNFAVIKAVAA